MPSLNMMKDVGGTDFPTDTLDRALKERADDPKPTREQLRVMERAEKKQRELTDFERARDAVAGKPAPAKTPPRVSKMDRVWRERDRFEQEMQARRGSLMIDYVKTFEELYLTAMQTPMPVVDCKTFLGEKVVERKVGANPMLGADYGKLERRVTNYLVQAENAQDKANIPYDEWNC